jgi:hypothetical protein
VIPHLARNAGNPVIQIRRRGNLIEKGAREHSPASMAEKREFPWNMAIRARTEITV